MRISVFVVMAVAAMGTIADGQSVQPQPAADAIFRAFDTHSIVMLGEAHWSLEQHRFIQRLLRDPRLPERVNDIAVEFGNSLYQGLIDRYVAGGDVPIDSLRLVWRNTTVSLAWDPTMYADIFATLRSVNRRLPPGKRLRVLAMDPPVEWSDVTNGDQFPRKWGYRDPVWYETLEREALSKGRKVLVIAGALHILRNDPPDFKPSPLERAGLGDALAQRYPNATYRIYPAIGRSGLAKLTQRWPTGSLGEVKGTAIGAQSAMIIWPASVTMFRTVNGKREPYTLTVSDFPAVESLIDAVLYYGPDSTRAQLPPRRYWDCQYLAELRRRNRVMLPVFGMDQQPLIDSLASHRACSFRP